MTIRFRRIATIVILLLLICLGVSYSHHNSNLNRLVKTRNVNYKLHRQINYKKHHAHRPVLTKTVPSAYKNMIDDGKAVSSAEELITNQTNGGKKKPNYNNSNYKKALTTMQMRIHRGRTVWPLFKAWTPFVGDKLQLLPGEANADGDYDCTFVVYRPKGHRIDAIIMAKYNNGTRKFEDVSDYGQRQKKLPPKVIKKMQLQLIKHNSRHPKVRHTKGVKRPHVR